jgi:nucleoside-triphosphate--adenylate kinase
MIQVTKILAPKQYAAFSTCVIRQLHSSCVLEKSSMPMEAADLEPASKFMLILGKPGGGKGTISNKILKDFESFKHFSTGDMLRQHVREKTKIGLEAKKHMDLGGLVPDEVIIDLVLDEAQKEFNNGNSLLLDGFPRTMEQARALGESVDVDLVVNLNVPNNTIIKRIADRWIHEASGRVYNYSYNPPRVHGLDNETGEKLVQRDDDKSETVKNRLEAYEKLTSPLVEYYEKKGALKTFSGTESDIIYPHVKDWLKGKFK